MQKDQPVVCPIEALQLSNDEVLTCIGRLIGTRYVPTVKAYISELTGRQRVVGIGEMSTREMDPQRVNISGNEAGLISGFHFG